MCTCTSVADHLVVDKDAARRTSLSQTSRIALSRQQPPPVRDSIVVSESQMLPRLTALMTPAWNHTVTGPQPSRARRLASGEVITRAQASISVR